LPVSTRQSIATSQATLSDRERGWWTALALKDVEEVVDDYTGLSRKVLDYSLIMKRLVDRAKQPGFSAESWAPLAELVAVDEFERVGNFQGGHELAGVRRVSHELGADI
jgi:hypothetical protein